MTEERQKQIESAVSMIGSKKHSADRVVPINDALWLVAVDLINELRVAAGLPSLSIPELLTAVKSKVVEIEERG